ncbi:hypothetical protein FACS189475_00070 [Betaproteobacteria bacterium]|nr:hypothetical protein FACS189475_00070 [Betaproteobacteria bacterium]
MLGQTVAIDTHGQRLDNSDGEIFGEDALELNIGDLANTAGLIAGRNLKLDAGSLNNQSGRIIQSGDGLTQVNLNGAFNNRSGLLASAGALDLTANELVNNNGQISADQSLTASIAGALSNASGQLIAGQNINLTTSGIDNSHGILGAIVGDLAATVNGRLDNTAGRIEAANALTLDSQELTNTGGSMLGQTTAIDTHGQSLDNSSGQIFGEDALTLNTGDLANTSGLIIGQHLLINAGNLDNRNTQGANQGIEGDAVTITARTLDNQSGRIVQTGDSLTQISLNGAFDNHSGLLASAGTLLLSASEIANGQLANNSGGQISAGQSLTANVTGALSNASGQLIAAQNLHLSATGIDNTHGILGAIAGDLAATVNGAFDNTQGRIEAANALTLDSQDLNNTGGAVLGQTVVLDTHGQSLDNSNGEIFGEDALELKTGDIANTAGLIAGGNLKLDADSLNNQSGQIVQNGDGLTQVNLNGAFDNRSGLLASAGALGLTANELSNNNGQISADQSLTANIAGALSNASGQLIAGQNLNLSATGIDNTHGILGAIAGNLAATVNGRLDNTQGRIEAANGLTLNSQGLTNTSGSVLGQSLTIDTHGQNLDNTAGQLFGENALTLNTGDLANINGLIAGQVLLINAGSLVNRNTQGANQGIEGGVVTITASALDNQSGRIAQSGESLTQISVGNAFDNHSGLLATAGALLLSAGEIGNTSGQISAGENLTANIAGALSNTGGQLIAAQNLHLSATGIDNTHGILGAIAGDLAATVNGALDNTQGRIEAANGLTLDSQKLANTSGSVLGQTVAIDTHGQSLDNSDGQLFGEDALTLKTGDLANTAGLIAGGNLKLDADSLNNQSGRIVQNGESDSLAQITLNGALDNSNGRIESTGALDITANGELNNSNGQIIADTDLTLNAASADNTNGLLSAGQNLSAHIAGALSNSGGTIIAGQNLKLETASLTGGGKVLSYGNLTLSLDSDYLNSGELSTAGNLSLTTTGNLDNTATGQILASGLTLAANTLTNRGLIDGAEVRIDTATLNNFGAGRIYGDHLAIAAGTLNNTPENGTAPVIAARERLDLGVGTLNNTDDALIFSAGDMAIGGALDANNQATGQASSILNSSATIEALSNLAIDTANLLNQKTAFEIQSGVPDSPQLTGRELLDYAPGLQFNWPSKKPSVTAYRDYVRNHYINVIANLLNGDLSNAERARLAAAVNARPLDTLLNSQVIWHLLLDTLAAEHPEAIDAMVQVLAAQNLPSVAHWSVCESYPKNCSYFAEVESTSTYVHDIVTQNSPAAVIRAGGDAVLNASDLANHYSLIQSGGDMVLTGNNLFNLGAELYRVTNTSTSAHHWHWLHQKDHGITTGAYSTQTLIDSVPGQIVAGGTLLASFTGGIDNITLRQNTAPVVSQIGNEPGATNVGPGQITTANTAITGAGASKLNTADTASNLNVSPGQIATANTGITGAGASKLNTADTASQLNAPASGQNIATAETGITGAGASGLNTADTSPTSNPGHTAPGQVASSTGTPSITRVAQLDPSGQHSGPETVIATTAPALQLTSNALLHIHPETGARYLVETDPRFTNYRSWLSSDYMLNALRLDPATLQKRLGDGYYEQRLISEQISQLTGRRFLDGYANDEEQYRALMAAGITYANEWQLIPGVGLTVEQMAMLTTDIVWLVEQEVTLPDGSTQTALVPQVYARVRESDLEPSGALIAANNLQLETTGDITNSGALAGRQVVALTAENIGILRGRVTGQDILAQANNDLTVHGGTIEAERTLMATAGHDLTVQSSTVDNRYTPEAGRFANALVQRTDIDRVAGLYVTGENGTLLAAAGNDLTLLAAALINANPTAAGNSGANGTNSVTLLSAGNNLTLGAITETNDASTSGKYRWSSQQIQNTGTTVLTDGKLGLQAGKDLTVIGSALEAAGQMSLVADGNLLIASVANETHDYLNRGKKLTIQSDRVIQQGSQLQAGGDLTLLAGENLALVSSNLSAGGNATLIAGDDLLLLATQNTAYDLFESRKKGSFGQKSYKRNESTVITSVGSAIDTGGDLILQSGNKQTYQAAQLTSGGNLTLDAGGDIDFQGVKDFLQESRIKNKSSWAWKTDKGQGHTDETLIQSQINAVGEQTIRAAGQIHIDLPEINAQTVSQTIDALVQADPGLAWLKEMEQRGDIDWRLVKEKHDEWSYSHSGMGPAVAIVVAIVAAVVVGPAFSAMIGEGAVAGTAMAAAVPASVTTGTAAVAAGWGNVALTAALTSVTTNATINLVNTQGDLGETLKNTFSEDAFKGYAAAALAGGVGGYYSDTYNLESLLAKTAAGCATGEITGSGCQQGATMAGAIAGLAWASDAMKQNQIENSKQFKGICLGDSDNCSNNFQREELGGGRWDLATICRTGDFSCSVRPDGFVSITGKELDKYMGTGASPFEALQTVFKENGGDLLSPMGGSQGSETGYLVGVGPYEKNSFWAKWVVEPFGGAHDWLNSFSAYETENGSVMMKRINFDGTEYVGSLGDALVPRAIGNIRTDYGAFAKFMNIIDIPLAAPFAAGTIVNQLPPGLLQSIDNAKKSSDSSQK